MVNKKVTLDLTSVDGNAFSLMGAFKQQAKRENWAKEEIDAVIFDCMQSTYDNLVATLADHCKSPEEPEEGVCVECGGTLASSDSDGYCDDCALRLENPVEL